MAITTIIPTITETVHSEYKARLATLFAVSDHMRVHIDVSDGTLTEYKTINETAVWWPKGWTVDLHMITAEPSKHVDNIIKLHPNLAIFHAEARDDLLPIFDKLKQNGIKVGVAIVKSVYPGSIKAILNAADYALIFSGILGKQGGTADLLLGEKAALIQDIHPGIEIGWDGGANFKNVRQIAHAGISAINVGNAISSADNPAKVVEELNKEIEKEDPI